MYTVETVLGREGLTLDAYEEGLASVGPSDVENLEQLAAQLCSDFPAEAARLMASVLLRDDLWDALGSSDEGWPLFLKLADAQDHALRALACCEQGVQQVALDLLLGMCTTIEQWIVIRIWQNLYRSTPALALVALKKGLKAEDGFARIERPLVDLLEVLKRGVVVAGLRPEQAQRVANDLDQLAGRFEERYADAALRATIQNPGWGVPGARFLVGLLALAYMQKSPVPSEGFWRDESLFCRGRTGGKRFFYETLSPAATATLMNRVLDPPDMQPDHEETALWCMRRGENFNNMVYTSLTMPGAAIPHLLNVLQTPCREERGWFLGVFRDKAGRWEPLGDALSSLVSEVERLLAELGPSPLEFSDERPSLWELAGAVEVLADVARAAAERPDHDIDFRALPIRLRAIERELDRRWPPPPSYGASTSWNARQHGWNPYTSIPERTYCPHPARLINRAAEQLSSD